MAEQTAPAGRGRREAPPLPAEGAGSLEWWQSQITTAEDKIKKRAPEWKKNVDRYLAQPLASAPVADTVIVPLDFANVEQKKAQLYFRNPDVQLTAAPGHTAQADAIQAFGVRLNEALGPDEVDAETMVDELLTDVLCPAGIGISVLGIEVTTDGTTQMQTGEQPGPLPPGSVLGLQTPPMVPVYEEVPKIIHQRYFWSRVSPLYGLIPARFHGRNFDRAPWLGYKFEMDKAVAMRQFELTEDEASKASDEPERLNQDEQPQATRDTDVVYGYCLSYQAHLYNPAVKHPEEIWRLILIKGVDRVIKHDRPYQQYAKDPKTGQPTTTLIGVRGHFIHVYTPRYVSDTAIPPSDVQMSRHQVDELSKGRSQMVQQRDRSRPMRQMNIGGLSDPNQAELIKRGTYQEIIFSLSNEPIVQEVTRASFPRENFEFDRTIKRDVDTVWALGDSGRGVAEESRRTATELSLRQGGSETRMEKERQQFARWYSRGAEKLAGLIQLFDDARSMVPILGADGAQKLVSWDLKALPLRFVCTVKPDTMVRQDSAGDFKRATDTYQMLANDPHVERAELLTAVLRKANIDPTKIVKRQLPDKGPEPPKVAFTIKGEDMDPSLPQFPAIQEILSKLGMTVSAQNVQMGLALAQKQHPHLVDPHPSAADGGLVGGAPAPDAAHGGAAQQAEPLTKHAMDQTGMLPGAGQASAVQ